MSFGFSVGVGKRLHGMLLKNIDISGGKSDRSSYHR